MSAPEHRINQFDVGTPIEDDIAFDSAVNLTGASVSFVYRDPEAAENTVRSAVVAGASPSAGAATSATVRRNLVAADVASANVLIYEWKITLADGTVIIRPLTAPTTEFPHRKRPCFEVVESLTTGGDEESEDPTITASSIPLVLATIAALKALPSPVNSNYLLAIVMSDENGALATFEFDASISEDSVLDSEYVLTAGGGGFRRKGL